MTVDEALEWADQVADNAPGATHEAILAAEVRRLRAILEPTPDELKLATALYHHVTKSPWKYMPLPPFYEIEERIAESAQLLAAHDARLLDEAAERGVRLVLQDGWLPGVKTIEDLADAIKGAAHE